jgi:cysteine-rich repeat protein
MRSILCVAMIVAVGCGSSSSMSDDSGDDAPPGCGDGNVAPGEQCDDGNDNNFDGCRADCTTVDKLMPTANTWQYFEIPGTQCIDGTPAGFSVNFNPASTKLAIYLEGGGACFNRFCENLFSRGPNMPSSGGIFDRNNTANPIKDWTWVYIPYCSGDVYGGQGETMLANKLRKFYGYPNHTAFLERLVPSFTSDQVLLTGSSAGGFGAAVNYAQTQRAFGDTPVALIDDSGPPMTAEVFPPCLQTLWRTTWGLEKTMLAECGADCTNPNDFIGDLFDHVRKTFPNMRGGLFSSVGDQTIRTFAGYGWGGGYNMCEDIPTAVTTTVYQAGLDALRTNAMAIGPSFGTFYIPGNSHTILRSANVYTTMAGGKTVAQWVTETLGGTTSHVGP